MLLALLNSSLFKKALIALALLALIFSVYGIGHSKGYDSGYASGHQIAWDTQQKTINLITDKENDESKAFNAKVLSLQQDSQAAAEELVKVKKQTAVSRNQIVEEYKTNYAQSYQSCGWDENTVTTINRIIEENPTVKEDTK